MYMTRFEYLASCHEAVAPLLFRQLKRATDFSAHFRFSCTIDSAMIYANDQLSQQMLK